jgi:hypothetical protein
VAMLVHVPLTLWRAVYRDAGPSQALSTAVLHRRRWHQSFGCAGTVVLSGLDFIPHRGVPPQGSCHTAWSPDSAWLIRPVSHTSGSGPARCGVVVWQLQWSILPKL